MQSLNLNDTIAAIATPCGEGGIGIVRISGKDALLVADKVFSAKSNKKPSTFKSHMVHYGWIMEAKSEKRKAQNEKIIDEVLLTVMRAPRTYTKEDIVEINCHGGMVALKSVLDLVLSCGARLAAPGEFTKRAFLNGRIDLAQAESVLDIIHAKSQEALRVSLRQLKGGLSERINKIRQGLLESLALLEANIEFPDEEIGNIDKDALLGKLNDALDKLNSLIQTSFYGKMMRDGIHVVICGKPNAGKSSLLNAILKEERSIVTPIAGTTRDTVEEFISLKGVPVCLVDTAGLKDASGLIEKEAMSRSRKKIKHADVVLVVFDSSTKLNKDDKKILRQANSDITVAVLNKIDLKKRIEEDVIRRSLPRIVEVSAKKERNIQALEEAIVGLACKRQGSCQDGFFVSNTRHIQALKEAHKLVASAVSSMDNNLLPVELVAQELKDALSGLDEVLGKDSNKDILDKIFSQFCIGK